MTTTKLTRTKSRAEVDNNAKALAAHCDVARKNEIYLDVQAKLRRSDGGPVLTRTPKSPLHACVYASPPGGDLLGARYIRDVSFDTADATTLRQALSHPGPTGTCPLERTFAVVATPTGNYVVVELGGCWRVQRDGPLRGGLGSANPAVVRNLLSTH